MAFGDIITYLCLAIAIWYVPRYLLRIYAPGVGPWIREWWQRGVEIQRVRYEQRASAYGLRDVNDYADDDTNVMSRSDDNDMRLSPSVSQTDEVQTSDRPMMPKPTPDKMLDIFKVLRAAGIDRDELRGPWRAAGLPLDNNLWAKAKPAAPEDDDVLITPYAGRRTKASFYPDEPELEYKPPR